MPWAMVLWPGLARIYSQGAWQGLAWAVGFTALVNLALVATFVHETLLPVPTRSVLWMALAVVWLVSFAGPSGWARKGKQARPLDPDDPRFQQALDHYLRANWFEAEKELKELLQEEPRDLDARLMLATLYRHTWRLDEAAEELEALGLFEGTEKWELEIHREWELLREARARQAERHGPPDENPAADPSDTPQTEDREIQDPSVQAA
jgi:hypothetical protein